MERTRNVEWPWPAPPPKCEDDRENDGWTCVMCDVSGLWCDACLAWDAEHDDDYQQDHVPWVSDSDDLLYEAWAVIANAHEGNWAAATPEWKAAAERWRDRWHATLSGSSRSDDA